jgi:hypothetical protein
LEEQKEIREKRSNAPVVANAPVFGYGIWSATVALKDQARERFHALDAEVSNAVRQARSEMRAEQPNILKLRSADDC